jgi:hypothetical protein
MKFTSFVAMGLMGCALALPHGPPDGSFDQATPTGPPPTGLPTPSGAPALPGASGFDKRQFGSFPETSGGFGYPSGPASSGTAPTGTPSAFPEPSGSFGGFERRQDFGIIPSGVPFSIPSGFPTSLPSGFPGFGGFGGIGKRQYAKHNGPAHSGPAPSATPTGVPQPSGGLPSASGVPFGFPPSGESFAKRGLPFYPEPSGSAPSGPAPSGPPPSSSAPSGPAPTPRV